MVDVEEVSENIYMIDERLYSIPRYGSVYLIDGERKALIDSGPSTSANAIFDGIRRVGVRPEDIDYVIVTHIHLDHAGGAGALIRDMPRAQVVVHHKGSKHLVDPARLVSSVVEVQGEEAMVRDGEVVPIAMERVKPARDGDVLRLSERQILRFIDAPGHGAHGMCIWESRNNGLFVGDAVGLYFTGDREVLLLATPPPGFNLELSLDTLEKLISLDASIIYFAHFGATNKVQEKLQLAMDKLRDWGDIVVKAMKASEPSSVKERLIAQACAELEPVKKMEPLYKYLSEVLAPMNVAGYIGYYQGKHEA